MLWVERRPYYHRHHGCLGGPGVTVSIPSPKFIDQASLPLRGSAAALEANRLGREGFGLSYVFRYPVSGLRIPGHQVAIKGLSFDGGAAPRADA